jgi:hypothetical protein
MANGKRETANALVSNFLTIGFLLSSFGFRLSAFCLLPIAYFIPNQFPEYDPGGY